MDDPHARLSGIRELKKILRNGEKLTPSLTSAQIIGASKPHMRWALVLNISLKT